MLDTNEPKIEETNDVVEKSKDVKKLTPKVKPKKVDDLEIVKSALKFLAMQLQSSSQHDEFIRSFPELFK